MAAPVRNQETKSIARETYQMAVGYFFLAQILIGLVITAFSETYGDHFKKFFEYRLVKKFPGWGALQVQDVCMFVIIGAGAWMGAKKIFQWTKPPEKN